MTPHDQGDLLDTDTASVTAPGAGYLVTNHLNLMYMLASGMVMPPAGFGEKYYADTLDCAPGWIPLFTGNPWRQAIEHSLSGARHLRPCVVKLSLRNLSGPVVTIDDDGVQERQFPREVGKPVLLFVPAPLPTSAVEKIVFRAADERKACERDVEDYVNVPWADFKMGTEKTRFGDNSGRQWPPAPAPKPRDIRLRPPQVAGGIMAMLRLMASRCADAPAGVTESLGVSACRLVFDPPASAAPELSDTILADLTTWAATGRAPESSIAAPTEGDQKAVWRPLFWRAVERLADDQHPAGGGRATGALLDFLDAASATVPTGLQERVTRLRDDLESLTGLGTFTISELFERYKTPLPRAMLLLFLRERCIELVEFESKALQDEDWLAAAVLFGAREGWMSLPLGLRGDATASMAVAHRMAAMSHRMAGTGFDLGPAPERPRPVGELFQGEWDAARRAAALRLAQVRKWDCIRTRVRLEHGDYRLIVAGAGTDIVFQGQPKAVDFEVDRQPFLQCLAEDIRTSPEEEPRLLALASDDAPARSGRGRSRSRKRNVSERE